MTSKSSMSRRSFVVGLAFAVWGCAPELLPLDATMYLSPDFDAGSQSDFVYAIDELRIATGGMVAFNVVVGRRQRRDGALIVPGALPGEMVLGKWDAPTWSMTLDVSRARRRAVDLHVVALHELGHAVGIDGHVDGTLMAATSGKGLPCVDDTTLDLISQIRGLPREKMRSTCQK